MQFRVVVPDRCEEGETLAIRISDGTNATVVVPSGIGLVAGDSFVFEIPTDRLKHPASLLLKEQQQQQTTKRSKKQQKKQKNQQQQQQQQPIPIAEIDTRPQPHSDDARRTAIASLVLVDDSSSGETEPSSSSSSRRNKTSFLEREICNGKDFLLALTVGLLVGSAIVFGFLLGILYSTEAIYTVHPIAKPKQQQKLATTTNRQQPRQHSGQQKLLEFS